MKTFWENWKVELKILRQWELHWAIKVFFHWMHGIRFGAFYQGNDEKAPNEYNVALSHKKKHVFQFVEQWTFTLTWHLKDGNVTDFLKFAQCVWHLYFCFDPTLFQLDRWMGEKRTHVKFPIWNNLTLLPVG